MTEMRKTPAPSRKIEVTEHKKKRRIREKRTRNENYEKK